MTSNDKTLRQRLLTAGTATTFVVLMGLVSLFGDMTYEAGHSLSGQYLKLLGAGAFAVGAVAGAGELLGHGVQLVSGKLADRSKRYWLLTLVGFAMNLLALPLLALVGRWEIAIVLLFAERIGKGIRKPARDAMLSYATQTMGRGWGFGLHEAMDQIGAIGGPLLVAAVLATRITGQAAVADYRAAFGLLFIPAAIALGILVAARFIFPRPQDLEVKEQVIATRGYSRQYWWFLAASGLLAFGFVDFILAAYHFRAEMVAPDAWIPVLYALAMAIDAIAALVLGRLYDRVGRRLIAPAVAISALATPLIFLGGLQGAIVGLGLWGIGMGAQESILRAAVADMVPQERRATGYGLFHTWFGLFWFLGSALMGLLYDRSLLALAGLSVVAQVASAILFMRAASTHTSAADA